ncbi:MAG: aminoglycoside phosphotransferase family protein, partial [Bacillota bacterium]|nr:aminoglycoside phosphotransferase family protein [Bacillota bacterium]
TLRKAFASFYLNSYIKLTNTSAKSIDNWLLPVMAARLVEGVHESEKQLLLKKIRYKLSSI